MNNIAEISGTAMFTIFMIVISVASYTNNVDLKNTAMIVGLPSIALIAVAGMIEAGKKKDPTEEEDDDTDPDEYWQ